MSVYWSMFALPAVFALVTGPRSHVRNALNSFGLFFVFLLFVVLIGLRFEIGADWVNYEYIVGFTAYESLISSLAYGDPGFSLVSWISTHTGAEVWGPNFTCGAILVTGLVIFCRKQDDVWLAITAAVPYLVIVVGMGYVRQAAAIGFILIGLTSYEKGKFGSAMAWIGAATLFHATAVCIAPFMAMGIVRKRPALVIPLGIVTAGLLLILLQSRFDTLYERYVESEYDSSGAVIRLMMNAVPALLFIIFRRRLPQADWSKAVWMLFSVLSLAMVVAVTYSTSTTLIDRLGLYFIPIQIYVFGNLAQAMGLERRGRLVVTVLTIIYYSAILFVWLNYATHAELWIPYRFLPFE